MNFEEIKKIDCGTKFVKNFPEQKKIIEILYPYKKGTKNFKNWKKYYKGATGLLGLVVKAKSKNFTTNSKRLRILT